ncbi:MAG TPA: helix-turn-helix domain-containing protein [Jiangellales bacterium]|nr:helix-turn-helix domain-containing protein [Jiangellales bacterium]
MTTSGVMHQTTGWTVDASTFAARLALVRMRMGWNMKEAARECGLNAQTWRLWEIDGITPRDQVKVAKQISSRTGCDYLWLLLDPDRGEGGEGLNARYDPLAERVIATIGSPTNRTGSRPKVRGPNAKPRTASSVRPTRRRAEPVGSPNRAELATV